MDQGDQGDLRWIKVIMISVGTIVVVFSSGD